MEKGSWIWMDGEFVAWDEANVHVLTHTLHYGFGVFEGIRAYNGRVFKLSEHVDRLFYSAKAILLKIPMSHRAICEAVRAACKRNKIRDGYIRLVVTRGAGTLGLDPNRCSNPQVIIIADKIQLYPETFYKKGLEIVTVPTTRNHTNAVNPAIKSLNYLNNILAKIEAINAGCVEAIMLNSQGFVAECTGDNVFMLKGGELLTPPLAAGALYGITRSVAIELAESLGIKAKEPNLTRYDLYNADEVFITGTAAEVVPVVKIDGRQIGSGKPGKLTKKLIKAYQDLTNSTGEVI